MRSSMGAAWIFSISLTFTILIVAYLAISVNYARAFKIKSNIVTKIEEHEGYNEDLGREIEDYLVDQGYTAYGRCENRIQVNGYEDDWELQDCLGNNAPAGECGVCVYRRPSATGDGDICAARSSYRVVAFFKFDLPLVSYFTSFQVGGESRYFYDFAGSYGC